MRINQPYISRQQQRRIISLLVAVVLLLGAWSIIDLYRAVNSLLEAEELRTAMAGANNAVDVTDNNHVPSPDDSSLAVNDNTSSTDDTQLAEVSAGVQDDENTEHDGDLPAPNTAAEDFSISLSRASDNPEISRAYGYDYNPNTEDYRFHRGCDVDLAAEAPVLAPAEASVEAAYTDMYWGGVVILDHGNGWKSIYKCIVPTVTAGDSVQQGDVLGNITRAPAEAVQDYHLHVEIEHDGASQNPASYW